eukprot:CAMPEP_0181516670 /NCGR_PEP_ID=MMETSP1110-20121109/64253_1 /TAXON_ID=174948 /ORGANISM="Symbiodinium sp., Strain CCMP421" /LENGTH=85 /DNA_ID=CAMNT_0023646813 /DNA_START=38 /DNA_END=290 /DNA_ORIENTATION=+
MSFLDISVLCGGVTATIRSGRTVESLKQAIAEQTSLKNVVLTTRVDTAQEPEFRKLQSSELLHPGQTVFLQGLEETVAAAPSALT